MIIMRRTILWTGLSLLWLTTVTLWADTPNALAPTGLLTDLLEQTETVWMDGFPSNMTLGELSTAIERTQVAEIRTDRPTFSWILHDRRNDVTQTGYEIQVATKPELFTDGDGKPDVWESGLVPSGESTSVSYGGKPLQSGSVYYWRVRTENNGEQAPWSEPRGFKTADSLTDDDPISRYPIVLDRDLPVASKTSNGDVTFFDFGRAAFGRLQVTITSQGDEKNAIALIRLGERIKEGRIDRNPPGATRFREYGLPLLPGTQTYSIKTRPDKRNSGGAAVRMPDYIGEVMPFRYAEIELTDSSGTVDSVVRFSAHYPFDETASFFHCDNDALNQVWNLCRYSIKATSFAGIYVDGDRERIPYEGDALLNQLSHYSIDREFSLARRTQDYLLFHPTWPTEWILQSVHMAWFDYLYTGDDRNLRRRYNDLKAKSLWTLGEEDGLIGTRSGKLTREILDSIHFSGKEIRDIVDWPHKGLAGNENAESGETDGFVFCDKNVVVNAYHYFALRSILHFAEILGQEDDALFFRNRIDLLRKNFDRVFFDSTRGIYRDGDSTDHASLHGNMFPLAFGLVSEENKRSVTDFIQSRGMRCSVYGAQFLLDAIYEGEEGDYGFERMTDNGLRGWLNMIRVGSTISLEAWDDRYKPNQDWNHAWGATPANIIPRKLLGVEPTAPAFAKMRIKPQIATLTEVSGLVPTIRGSVRLEIHQTPKTYRLDVTIPANTRAEIWLPAQNGDADSLIVDEKEARDVFPNLYRQGNFWIFPIVGSGRRVFERR